MQLSYATVFDFERFQLTNKPEKVVACNNEWKWKHKVPVGKQIEHAKINAVEQHSSESLLMMVGGRWHYEEELAPDRSVRRGKSREWRQTLPCACTLAVS